MRDFLGKLVRVFIYLTYPILIVLLIASAVLFVYKNNQYHTTYDSRAELQTKYDDQAAHIANIDGQLADLQASNDQLQQYIDSLQQTGIGTISGKIFPFVTADSKDFTQYQRVCAVSEANVNEQFCRTVAAIDQTYTMTLPEGSYQVYAEVFPVPTNAFAGYKAYYTEYVKCTQTKKPAECDIKTLTKPVSISVKAGNDTPNVDPVDWQKR